MTALSLESGPRALKRLSEDQSSGLSGEMSDCSPWYLLRGTGGLSLSMYAVYALRLRLITYDSLKETVCCMMLYVLS